MSIYASVHILERNNKATQKADSVSADNILNFHPKDINDFDKNHVYELDKGGTKFAIKTLYLASFQNC